MGLAVDHDAFCCLSVDRFNPIAESTLTPSQLDQFGLRSPQDIRPVGTVGTNLNHHSDTSRSVEGR